MRVTFEAPITRSVLAAGIFVGKHHIWCTKRGYYLPGGCFLMTSAEYRNDLMPAQENLEWVTPQISPMVAGDSEGKPKPGQAETSNDFVGPS